MPPQIFAVTASGIEDVCPVAVMAIISLILYYACPNTPYHVTAATVLAKIYSNSVLAIFNSRIRIVGGREEAENGQNLHLSLRPSLHSSTSPSGTANARIAVSQIGAIRIQEDIYVHTDVSESPVHTLVSGVARGSSNCS